MAEKVPGAAGSEWKPRHPSQRPPAPNEPLSSPASLKVRLGKLDHYGSAETSSGPQADVCSDWLCKDPKRTFLVCFPSVGKQTTVRHPADVGIQANLEDERRGCWDGDEQGDTLDGSAVSGAPVGRHSEWNPEPP